MIRYALLLTALVLGTLVSAQDKNEIQKDTVYELNEVVVEAYEHERPLLELPAAIGVVSKQRFERFDPTSFLSAFNTITGVRMEERSPGSYRISIRGSTLRSPFGIRNVKVYWNDMPFTDPGGNTYLNLLDLSSVGQVEIIKGPGGSLYGAGTGGVILLKSPKAKFGENKFGFSSTGGSFGLLRYAVNAQSGTENANVLVQYSHQQSDGYREQTKMTRDVMQVQGSFRAGERRTVNATVLYADLYYQTPGGITKAQYDENPKQARQPGGPFAGAVEQKAAIRNKTFYGGLSQDYQWNNRWSNATSLYGSFTQFENPFIFNYERRTELNFGGRTNTQYDFEKGKLNFGAEFQHGFSPINVYDNNGGITGNLQNSDEITSVSSLIFSQLELFLPAKFFLTAGASLNFSQIQYTRLSETPPFQKEKKFDPIISPRLALLKKLNDAVAVYGSVSRGFSPPTVAELYPSTATFNNKLNPEKGTSYEIGLRGKLFNNLQFDMTGYSFKLNETIVVQYTLGGENYFINAGKTNQDGVELTLSWKKAHDAASFISDFGVWISCTLNHYRFADYVQDSVRYSGSKLTGVPPTVVVSGIDVGVARGFYCNLTATYTDKIPLNDANTIFSDPFVLLNAKAGYRKDSGKFPFGIFVGVNNALDEKYSLGNDLNAAGNRYFNAAPPANFYIGFTASIVQKANKE